MGNKIVFVKNGRDTFIDFIKAYAILWVLIGHFLSCSKGILYPIIGGNQVPLFVAVQCFHYFKYTPPRILNVSKILTRVIIPFFLIQLFIAIVLFVLNGFSGLNFIIGSFFINGGYGQGDYYPLIYIQIALLLPLFYKIISRIESDYFLLFFFVVFCELIEIMFSYIQISDTLYRILALRYFLLIYFGWKWVNFGM